MGVSFLLELIFTLYEIFVTESVVHSILDSLKVGVFSYNVCSLAFIAQLLSALTQNHFIWQEARNIRV